MNSLETCSEKNNFFFAFDFSAKTLCLSLLCAVLILPAALLSSAASAQVSAAAALEEILITARKRTESLQDVPLSVTAFNEEAMERAGIESMQDLSDFTPGFDFSQAFGRQDFRPAIRGQSTIQGGANAGLFIDGFYIGEGAQRVPYAALQRVEVAKGPQSALYGRSTLAGAINYILKRPTEELETVIDLSVGEDSELRLDATVSGMLSPQLGFMVSLSGYEYGGQYKNRFRGLEDADGDQIVDVNNNPFVRGTDETVDIGEEETYSLVALLEWSPMDRMRITARFMHEKIDDGPYGIAKQPASYNNCSVGSAYRESGYYCGEVNVEAILDDEYNNQLNLDTGYYDDPGLESDATRISATLEYDLDWGVLTVNAGWHDVDYEEVSDDTFGAAPGIVGDANVVVDPSIGERGLQQGAQRRYGFIGKDEGEVNETQLEVRFSSPEDQQFRWIAGTYWYDFEEEEKGATSLEGFPFTIAITEATLSTNNNIINDAIVKETTIAVPGVGQLTLTPDPSEERTNWAIFGALEYDLSDALTLGLELRYTEEDVEFSDVVLCDDENDCTNSVIDNGKTRQNYSETFDATLFRATVDYRFNDDVLLYGVISSGNKPGQFNPSSIAATLPRSKIPVDEETARMYELGLKASAWEDHLQLAVALYQTDWEDQVLSVNADTFNGGTTSVNENLGETKIRGLELEMQARLTDFWELRFGYAYTDTEIEKYDVVPRASRGNFDNVYAEAARIFANIQDLSLETGCSASDSSKCPTIDGSGGELPQVSRNQLSLSNTFYGTLSGMDWYLRTDYLYRSKRYAQIYNLAHTGESAVINMRLGLSLDQLMMAPGEVEVAVWGKNIGDDRTSPALIRYIEGSLFSTKRSIGFTLPRERSFGVDLTYKF